MAEYIFELTDALYNEETGETVWNPIVKGELVRCKDCRHDRNCEIQYSAQAVDLFFCGRAERRQDASFN